MNYYKPSRETDEACEDFALWSFRFGLAFWGFLIAAFVALLAGQPRMSLVSFGASTFWFWAGAYITHKHARWHYEKRERGEE